MGAMDALSTIGYEGAALDDFLATLLRYGVTTLVDVREAPISRRPEFVKRALAAALDEAGIAYRHEGALGAPKPLRDRLKKGACTRDDFFDAYAQHLAGQTEQLARLAAEVDGHAALLCYERDVSDCHRKLVASALEARTGLMARHLVPAAAADEGQLDLPLAD